MDRCRQKRLEALRRLIEDAEASGISECSVEEIFAEARALSEEPSERLKREMSTLAYYINYTNPKTH